MAQCPECGGPLTAGVREGLCTRCLMAQGVKLASGLATPEIETEGAGGPRSFGDYELLEEVARGGMGVVYRARQRSLDRIVAVKLLRFGPHASPEQVKRFRAEATAAASLQHPNIVAIHEVGMQQGEQYLVMDLVDGPNLAGFVKDQPLPPKQAAGYLKTIAEAIQYAHERGILHRDLKPSNVLIGADDQPRVTDFGLAKRMEGDSSLTLSGQVLGSPSYMPPEQAGTGRGKVGRRSDVYALGAMLYHMLVGRPPFVGEGLNQTLEQVFNSEPVSPRLLNPAVPRDVETICLKCLEKEPARRYPTAQALAEDLGRFLRDEPIHARPVSQPERVWRWCLRKPALATLILLVHLVGAAGLAGIVWQWRQAKRERVRTEQNLYVANLHRANDALADHDLAGAQQYLRAVEQSPVQRAMRGWEWRYLTGRAQSAELVPPGRHDSWLADLAVSPDRRWLATISEDGVVKLWDFTTEKVIGWTAHAAVLKVQPDWRHHAVTFTPDGRALITAGEDGAIRFWKNLKQPQEAREHAITNLSPVVNRLAVSPDGRLLAGQGWRDRVYVWRLSEGPPELIREFEVKAVVPSGLAFAPDGQSLLVGWPNAPISKYDLSAEPDLRDDAAQLLPGTQPPFAFSPDGHWLVSAGSGRHAVQRWIWPGLTPLPKLAVQGGSVNGFAFSPELRVLAAGLGGGQINTWALTNRAPQTAGILMGHQEPVTGVAFVESRNEVRLISVSQDKTVRLWNPAVAAGEDDVLQVGAPVRAVAFSPDGHWLATVTRTPVARGQEATARTYALQLWDLGTRSPQTNVTFGGEGHGPRIVFAPDSQQVAVTDFYTLDFYKVPSLELEARAGGRGLVYAPDGKWLAYIGETGIVKRTALDAPEKVWVPASSLQELALSADGRMLAGCTQSGATNYLWDARDGRLLGPPLSGHTLRIVALAFTPDSRILVSAGWDGRLGFWDLTRRQDPTFLRGHNNGFHGAVLSPDGGTIATCGDDFSVRLWNVACRQQIAVLGGHTDIVNDVAFSRNDRWLASASNDGTVRLWHAPSWEELEASAERAPRSPARQTMSAPARRLPEFPKQLPQGWHPFPEE